MHAHGLPVQDMPGLLKLGVARSEQKMLKLICDKCGARIKMTRLKNRFRRQPHYTRLIFRLRDDDGDDGYDVDLCNDCADKLQEWIFGGAKDET